MAFGPLEGFSIRRHNANLLEVTYSTVATTWNRHAHRVKTDWKALLALVSGALLALLVVMLSQWLWRTWRGIREYGLETIACERQLRCCPCCNMRVVVRTPGHSESMAEQQWKGDDTVVVAPGVVTTTLDGWHYEHAPGETWADEEEGAPLLLLIEPSHGREVLLMDENAAASKLQSVTRGQYARSAALNRQRPRD